MNSAIDREIDAAKRIAEKQIDTTVRNRVANSQPRQVSSEDLVRGQVDRTLVRTALQRESREIDQRLHQVWNDDPNGVPDCDELNDIGRTRNFKSQATTRFGNWRVSMQATRNDSGRAKMRWWMTWNSTDTDDRKTSNRKTVHCFVKWIEEEYAPRSPTRFSRKAGYFTPG